MTDKRAEEIRAEVCPSCDHPHGRSWSLWQGSVRLTHGIYESEARVIIAIVAQAERDRDAARAEAERLKRHLGECHTRATSAEVALARVRAEVGRLKEEVTHPGAMTGEREPGWTWKDEHDSLQATLARTRATLEKYGKHDPHCHVEINELLTYDASRPAAICTCGLRAALEGRG